MENDVTLAGIYLDPKQRCLLTDGQQSKAKNVVCDVAIRMKSHQECSGEENENVSASSYNNMSDTEFDFEKVIDKQQYVLDQNLKKMYPVLLLFLNWLNSSQQYGTLSLKQKNLIVSQRCLYKMHQQSTLKLHEMSHNWLLHWPQLKLVWTFIFHTEINKI